MSKLFTFTSHVFGGSTEGTLNLYLRSTAGHKVTVEYVYTDDESKNDSKFENVKYAEEKSFGSLDKKDYGYEITVSSGDAKYEVNSLNVLRVTGGAEASVITVTYTPKDVIYIDQYYDNGKLWVKWTENNIKVNGPELLNGAAEAAVIEGENLTDAVENYRFLTVDGVTYDFSFASLVPVKGSILQPITDVWYDRDEGTWYYSHTDRKGVLFGLGDKVPVVNRGCVNFCYNTPHTENSEHHDWKWVHVDGTEKENSQHQQVCKHCNKEGTIERCKFDLPTTETGTHTCKDCGYSYTDEITPTGTPVYVYFKTVNTKNELVKVESGVTYNANGSSWATLGKLVTATPVTPEKKNILGAEVKTSSNFVKHDSNKDFDLDWISEWVDLKRDNGAAGYESEAPFGTHVWHLDGQVNVYKLSYDANRPAGVTADVTVPDSAYYLPGWNAPVSTDDPTLQGYNFGGWYKEPECVNEAKYKVAVAEDTVLYAKWTPLAQPTADLIDDDITIKHGVNGDPEHGNDSDSTVHIVKKDAKISYQATLDMKNLDFGANPEHADTVSNIQGAMTSVGATSLWDFIKNNSIDIFADSKVNLYVKFSDKLENPATLDGITLKSGWFKLDPNNKPTYNNTTGYWTIPCVIKDAGDEPDTNDSIVTLSRITLPLTAKAQGELSSDTELNVISEGYIDGTIKISTHELSLIGKSKDAPAKNTAKLKLAVPTYTVTYDGNGADSGKTTDNTAYATGAKATVKANGYTRDDYTFTGWNTKADGSGKSYAEGDPIEMLGNVVLYAQWTRNSSHDDDDDKYFFAIQKVDAQDGHALNGAKFKLYQLDKNDRIVNRRVVETRQQSSKNGIALFGVDNKNSYDGIWYYAEVSAPEGYVLDNTEHKIKATDFYDSLSTAVKYADTVRNYRGTTPDLLNDSDHFAYVIGYMDGNVRPYGLISRAETTTIFFRLLKDSVRDGNLLTSNTYTDVADDYWANTAISTMTGLGIVQGRSTTTFDPKAPITRAQFAAICARFDTGKSSGTQSFTDIKGHWAEKYIERAAELGWIKGFEDGSFRPDTYITRAQAMTMINRVLNRIPEDESDLLPGMNVWPDCNPGDWFYLAVQEATNSHDFEHKAGNYEIWTELTKNPDWTRYEN
ncbi:S-layer homology domain-containing protein [Dysosmobacter sp.]|uniref:S-layer homology domain-containing protein n=1 Tax=Dysosmobacter sp. TaxID=2591382 RepID=UPI003AF01238